MTNKQVFLIAIGSLALSAEAASAQQLAMPRMGYPVSASQSSPVLSPYLNMTELPYNGVGTYQTLVQPFVEQRAMNIQQGYAIQRLQGQMRSAPSGSQRDRGPTRDAGRRAGFMNYSHYYGTTGSAP